jgi:adenosylmethionine-8-amino-7-oxononanoate aminotransferase
MCAVEFVSNRETKAAANIGDDVREACTDRGLFTRNKGDILSLSPPLVINEDEVDKMVEIIGEAIEAVAGG